MLTRVDDTYRIADCSSTEAKSRTTQASLRLSVRSAVAFSTPPLKRSAIASRQRETPWKARRDVAPRAYAVT